MQAGAGFDAALRDENLLSARFRGQRQGAAFAVCLCLSGVIVGGSVEQSRTSGNSNG